MYTGGSSLCDVPAICPAPSSKAKGGRMGRPPVETIGVVAERPSQSETKRNATANAEASTRRSGQATMPRNVPGTSWAWPPHVARHPRKHHVSPSEATSSQSVRQRRCRARPDYRIEPDAPLESPDVASKGRLPFAAMKSGNLDSRRNWRSCVKGIPYVVVLHPHRAKTVSPSMGPPSGITRLKSQ